jgi:hypothetical protein
LIQVIGGSGADLQQGALVSAVRGGILSAAAKIQQEE